MYVTAHLVRSKEDEEGINAFLHLHGREFPWPDDASRLADSEPGKTVRSRIDLRPGGNRVRAYLDVLAPDETDRSELDRALTELSRDLGERKNPTVFTQGAATIRFGVELGLYNLRAQHLQMLVSAVLQLLDQDPRPPRNR
jgi:hypothetical protein